MEKRRSVISVVPFVSPLRPEGERSFLLKLQILVLPVLDDLRLEKELGSIGVKTNRVVKRHLESLSCRGIEMFRTNCHKVNIERSLWKIISFTLILDLT